MVRENELKRKVHRLKKCDANTIQVKNWGWAWPTCHNFEMDLACLNGIEWDLNHFQNGIHKKGIFWALIVGFGNDTRESRKNTIQIKPVVQATTHRPSMKNHKMFRSPVVFVHALEKKQLNWLWTLKNLPSCMMYFNDKFLTSKQVIYMVRRFVFLTIIPPGSAAWFKSGLSLVATLLTGCFLLGVDVLGLRKTTTRFSYG